MKINIALNSNPFNPSIEKTPKGCLFRPEDGSAYQKVANKNVLDLVLFCDDQSPAGAFRGGKDNTFLNVYLAINNFKTTYQTQRADLPLVLVTPRPTADQGLEDVFYDIRVSLRNLKDNGIVIKTKNGLTRCYARITHLVGDNKGIHEFLGISQNFSKGQICK